ncbi:MAG: carboxypeptidase-like regulatory domain-containing protein [Tannerella sp.]|jgi:hypothetical protein|nr:carboxypeptidase-like regulatory domain-containing protein [Tannerella sp.]
MTKEEWLKRPLQLEQRMKIKIILSGIIISTLLTSCHTAKTHDYYSGFVVDEAGNAISGVSVCEDLFIENNTLTDENGYFKFKRTENWIPNLIFSKAGFKTDTISMVWLMHGEKEMYSSIVTTDSSSIVLHPQAKNEIDTGTVSLQWKHLEGNWVLTDYIDNILKYKTIAKYRSNPLALNTWAFRVDKDSLFSTGLLYGFNIASHATTQNNNDTLALIETFGEPFILSYNKKTDKIKATNTKNPHEKYTYRRATGKLNEILSDTPFDCYQMENSMYDFLVNHLLVGSYEPVSDYKNIQTLIIQKRGIVKGFKNFDRYHVHTYFGTLHPYNDEDIIAFGSSESEDNGEIYSWKFSDETLTLTQMYTRDGGDSFHNGKTTYTFAIITE